MYVPYSGGPVVYCPTVYTSFWGSTWTSAPNNQIAAQLNQFMQDLMVSPWMNVLTQYGPSGVGTFVQASFLEYVPTTLTVSQYQAILQSCINAGLLPEPANVNTTKNGVPVVMIFLDQTVSINGGGRQLNIPGAQDAGYHEWLITAAGNPLLYAFHWYQSNVADITWVASHEFAETLTDPLYNAWTPDNAGHEIGDYCDANNFDFTVSGRQWVAQTVWSNDANACVSSAPAKLAPLSPGPFGAAGVALSRQGRGPSTELQTASITPHDRVLPLPAVHFNHLTGSVQTKEAELTAYARKLFHPLRHEHLFSDFPGFLHQAATALAAAPRRRPTGGGPAADSQTTTAEATSVAKQIKGVARAPMVEANVS
jgi:hypothetical protein